MGGGWGAAKLPTVRRTDPTRDFLAQNANSVKAAKP